MVNIIFLAVSFAALVGNEQRLVQQKMPGTLIVLLCFVGSFVGLVFWSPHFILGDCYSLFHMV